MAGWEYGNTRLRARWARRIDAASYERLLTLDENELLSTLAQGEHREDAAAAMLRHRGARAVLETVRLHLGRALREMRSFYEGRTRAAVELLLERHDLQNLATVLRGQLQAADPDAVVRLLVPGGAIAEPLLVELARRPDLRACVDTLVAWRLPSARVAWALAREQQRPGPRLGARLEHVLARAHADDVASALAELEVGGDLARALGDELDLANLLTALRLWTARTTGGLDRLPDPDEAFLPHGRIAVAALAAAATRSARANAVAVIAREPLRPEWQPPLAAWGAGGSLTTLAAAVERAHGLWAITRFFAGDPLGVAVPIAFVFGKETEARNLRLVAASAATAGAAAAVVRAALVLT